MGSGGHLLFLCQHSGSPCVLLDETSPNLSSPATEDGTVDDATKIENHLKGAAREKERRGDILADLLQAAAGGGPEAVTNQLTQQLDALEEDFDARIKELRKKL